MARRPDAEELASRAPRSRGEAPPSMFDNIRWGRVVLWTFLGFLVLVGSLFAWHRTEEFLIRDNRFRLAEADDLAGKSPSLKLEGLHYASTSQVRHVFAPDLGRSLYLVPLAARRQELLAIDWVEAATVSKIWPDTLSVHIVERRPVAFVQLPPQNPSGLSEFVLIDREGYILRPRVAAKFTLPVIAGIRESESREDRRARVLRVLAMLHELGPLANNVSEIDASDPNNLVAAEHYDNRVLNLMLGESNFATRVSNFLNNYAEIKSRRPDASLFDLRVDNLITVVGEQQNHAH